MRSSGKTTAMVLNLPAGGSVVLVHNQPMRDYVARLVDVARSLDVRVATQVIAATDPADIWTYLRGRNVPVVVDHAFWSALPLAARQQVQDLVEAHNQRHAAVR